MKKFSLALSILLFLAAPHAFSAGRYDFLDRFEIKPPVWTSEPSSERATPAAPELRQNLDAYYTSFEAEGTVRIYYGWGYQSYTNGKEQAFFNMLKQLAAVEAPYLTEWNLNLRAPQISFKDSREGINFVIDLGEERDAFGESFANHHVVMYHGHSRYGRGPAFQTFWNYFRMGSVFQTIEVDTTNSYFQDEPTQLLQTYPEMSVDLGGTEYQYQYRGQKTHSSYLPSTAYTKNIPGYAVDLQNATFQSGHQIFWLYSCSNDAYFKQPLRQLFPNPAEKFFFGTNKEGYWGEKPAAVFLMSLVNHQTDSGQIVADLNETHDCSDCFTSY